MSKRRALEVAHARERSVFGLVEGGEGPPEETNITATAAPRILNDNLTSIILRGHLVPATVRLVRKVGTKAEHEVPICWV